MESPSLKKYGEIKQGLINTTGKNDLFFFTEDEGVSIKAYVNVNSDILEKSLQESIDYVNENKVTKKCRTPTILKENDKKVKFGSLSTYFKADDLDDFKKHEKIITSKTYKIAEDLYLEIPIVIDDKIKNVVFIILKKDDKEHYSKIEEIIQAKMTEILTQY